MESGSKNTFELENLEQRLLLSGNPLLTAALGVQAGADPHRAAPSATLEQSQTPLVGQSATPATYDPASQINGIFDGLTQQTVTSSPAETAPSTEANSPAPTAVPSAAAAVEQAVQKLSTVTSSPGGQAAIANEVLSSAGAVNGAGNVLTLQLTETLHAANGPPAEQVTTQAGSVSSTSQGSVSGSVGSFLTLRSLFSSSSADTTTTVTGSPTWTPQGPNNVLGGQVEGMGANSVTGAVNVAVTDPNNADIVYVGTVNGGVWKTTNATAVTPTWTNLTDQFPSLAISALAMDPTNSNILYAGTGSTSSSGQGGPAIGLLKTTDGGATWSVLASSTFSGLKVTQIIPYEAGLNTGEANVQSPLLVSTLGNGTVGQGGIYRSIDGGQTWTRISGNTNVGGTASGLPDAAVVSMVRLAPNSATFFAAVSKNGTYQSTDAGRHWQQVQNIPDAINQKLAAATVTSDFADNADNSSYNGAVGNTIIGLGGAANLGSWYTLQNTGGQGGAIVLGTDPTNNRVVDGLQSFEVFAGNGGSGTGYAAGRTSDNPLVSGTYSLTARFDVTNTAGFSGFNLKSAKGSAFADSELLRFGLDPSTGNTKIYVMGLSGEGAQALDFGATDLRGAVVKFSLAFDTGAGTYTLTATVGTATQSVSGHLAATGAAVTDLGFANFNNGALQNLIFDSLAVTGTPGTVTDVYSGVVRNLTTTLANGALNGANQLTLGSVTDILVGDSLFLNYNPPATTLGANAASGTNTIVVANLLGFAVNSAVVVGAGAANQEAFYITAINNGTKTLTLNSNLTQNHVAGETVTEYREKVQVAAVNPNTNTVTLQAPIKFVNHAGEAVVDTSLTAQIYVSATGANGSWAEMATPSSTDGTPGSTRQYGLINGQAQNFTLAVDPSNPNLVYVGGDLQPILNKVSETLGANAAVGDQSIQVAGAGKFVVGDTIYIDYGTAQQEAATVTKIGSAATAVAQVFAGASVGDTTLFVNQVNGVAVGDTLLVDGGTAAQESVSVTGVKALISTSLTATAAARQNLLQLTSSAGFQVGDAIFLKNDSGRQENATVAAVNGNNVTLTGNLTQQFRRANTTVFDLAQITLAAALTQNHAAGAQVNETNSLRFTVTSTGAGLANVHNAGAVIYANRSAAGNTNWTARIFRGDSSALPAAQWGQVVAAFAHNTSPHADDRALTFDANGNLIDLDDGGIYRLNNTHTAATRTWVSLNGNLAITEFGAIAYDPLNGIITGGTQDNGALAQSATNSQTWNMVSMGDGNGQAVAYDPTNPNQVIRYSMGNNFGTFYRLTFDNTNTQLSKASVWLSTPANLLASGYTLAGKLSALNATDKGLSFDTIPFVVNAVDPSKLLLGYTGLYESANTKVGSLAGPDSQPGDAVVMLNQDLNNKVTALAYGGMFNGVANPNVIYVARGNSISVREAGGNVFARTTAIAGAGAIQSISLDPTNWKVAYAVDSSHVYATVDAGATWTDITGPSAMAGALGATLLRAVQIVKVPAGVGTPALDVLLVGGVGGVYRLFNPVGDPTNVGTVNYPVITAAPASVTVVSPGDQNDLLFTAKQNGAQLNGVTISFVDTGKGAGNETVQWNPFAKTLVFDITTNLTTAARVQTVLKANPAANAVFDVTFPNDNGTTGSGKVALNATGTTTGGRGLSQWTQFGTGLPNAMVTQILYTPQIGTLANSNVLVVAERGRGAWKFTGALSQLAQPSVLTITGDGSGNAISLALNPANLLQINVYTNSVLKGTFAAAAFNQIVVTGGAGNDTLQVDSRLRLPGGILYDGQAGNNSLIVIGADGDTVVNNVNNGGIGSLTIGGAVANGALTVSFQNVATVQTSVTPDQLAAVRGGLNLVSQFNGLNSALSSKVVPLIGPSLTQVLNAAEVQVLPNSDPIPGGGDAAAQQVVNSFGSVLDRLLQSGSSGLRLSDIGGAINSWSSLVQFLDGLDNIPGNVVMTQSGGVTRIDMQVVKTLGGTANLDVNLLGGALYLKGSLDVSVQVTLHLVFGVDSQGFFIDTNPADTTAPNLPLLTISNLQVNGSVSAGGHLGFLDVAIHDATLTVNPAVALTVSITSLGTDPVTGVPDNGLVRLDELPDFTSLFSVSLTGGGGVSTPDLVFNADVTVGFSSSALGLNLSYPVANITLTWNDITKPNTVTFSSQNGVIEGMITQFENAILNGLDKISSLGSYLQGLPAFNTQLPLVDKTLNQLLNVGSLLQLKSAVQTYFSQNGLPTMDGLVGVLATQLASAVGNNAQGSFSVGPLTISGGFFPDSNQLRIDVDLELSKSFQFPLDLGADLAALGFSPTSSVNLTVEAGLSLNFAFGIDLNSLFAGNGVSLNDFFLQVNRAALDVGVSLNNLNLALSGNLGGATGSLSVNNGTITLDAMVGLVVNAPDGKLTLADLSNSSGLSTLIGLTPAAFLSIDLPLSGTLTGPSFSISGTLDLQILPFDVLSGNAPAFVLTVVGSIEVGGQSLSGTFRFERNGTTVNGTVSVTTIQVGASNVDAFLGAGPVYLNDGVTINPNAVGIHLTNGSFGMLLQTTVDSTNPSQAVSAFAFSASGSVTFLGFPGLTFTAQSMTLQYNTIGAVNTAVPTGAVAQDGVTPVTVQLNFPAALQLSFSGVVTLSVVDPATNSQFVLVTGGFIFTESQTTTTDSTTSKKTQTTTILIGAAGVEAFFGVGPARLNDGSINPNAVGVLLENGQVAAEILNQVDVTDAANPQTLSSTYAVDASGSAQLVNVTGLTLGGTFHVRINTTGAAVTQTIGVPDPANPANIINVPLTFAGNETLALSGTNVDLSVNGFVTLSGSFALSKTFDSSTNTTQILVGATGINAFLGTADQKVGLQVSNADLGLVIYDQTTTTAGVTTTQTTYALDASASAQLVGFGDDFSLSGTVGVRVNTTGGPVNQTITVGGVNVNVNFSSTEGNFEGFSGAGVTLNVGGYVTVTGDFAFTKQVDTVNNVTDILAGGTGVNVFLGSADAGMGVQINNANLGVIIEQKTTTVSTFGFAVDGS
ncbi:MAG: LEPR-XLL domain-containing protein, partial [Verrucomicrobia bacterium]|nr:LEPR-XLL domain-containing protein [Verrucomicrobiota bacterium]